MNSTASSFVWQSNNMEPTIDFGDEIKVTPTNGIEGDGIYMLHYGEAAMQPDTPRRLCVNQVKVIRRIKRLGDGILLLSYDSPCNQYDEVVSEKALASWCRIAGAVEIVKRNGRGFHHTSNYWTPAKEGGAA